MAYKRHRKHRLGRVFNDRPRGIKKAPSGVSVPKADPVLSSDDRAALINMQPVTIREIMSGERRYPTSHPPDVYGEGRMVGEYSIRSCNNNRPRR